MSQLASFEKKKKTIVSSFDQKLDRLEREVRHVLRLHELNKHVNYSHVIVEKVNKSFASSSFATVQSELFSSEMLGVCRLWDNFGSDRCSLPTLFKLASDPDFQAAFDKLWLPKFVNGSNLPSQKRWNDLEKVAIKVAQIVRGPVCDRVRKHRDKFLAHILELSDSPSRRPAAQTDLAQYGDEGFLLRQAVDLTTELFALVKDGYVNFDVSVEAYAREAKLFSESIRFLTTREYNASRTT